MIAAIFAVTVRLVVTPRSSSTLAIGRTVTKPAGGPAVASGAVGTEREVDPRAVPKGIDSAVRREHANRLGLKSTMPPASRVFA